MPRRRPTVLVAEDEELVRRLVVRVLDRLGYHILEACSGQDALAAASRHAGTIDVLLTDVMMPGMDGADLARILDQQHSKLRVIFMSGYRDPTDQAGTRLRNFGGILRKPFTSQDLALAVSGALDPVKRS